MVRKRPSRSTSARPTGRTSSSAWRLARLVERAAIAVCRAGGRSRRRLGLGVEREVDDAQRPARPRLRRSEAQAAVFRRARRARRNAPCHASWPGSARSRNKRLAASDACPLASTSREHDPRRGEALADRALRAPGGKGQRVALAPDRGSATANGRRWRRRARPRPASARPWSRSRRRSRRRRARPSTAPISSPSSESSSLASCKRRRGAAEALAIGGVGDQQAAVAVGQRSRFAWTGPWPTRRAKNRGLRPDPGTAAPAPFDRRSATNAATAPPMTASRRKQRLAGKHQQDRDAEAGAKRQRRNQPAPQLAAGPKVNLWRAPDAAFSRRSILTRCEPAARAAGTAPGPARL